MASHCSRAGCSCFLRGEFPLGDGGQQGEGAFPGGCAPPSARHLSVCRETGHPRTGSETFFCGCPSPDVTNKCLDKGLSWEEKIRGRLQLACFPCKLITNPDASFTFSCGSQIRNPPEMVGAPFRSTGVRVGGGGLNLSCSGQVSSLQASPCRK